MCPTLAPCIFLRECTAKYVAERALFISLARNVDSYKYLLDTMLIAVQVTVEEPFRESI